MEFENHRLGFIHRVGRAVGVQYCIDRGVVHGDLTPSNVVLGDFGET